MLDYCLYNSSTKTLYDYIDTILKVRCDQLVVFLKEVQDYCKINKIWFEGKELVL